MKGASRKIESEIIGADCAVIAFEAEFITPNPHTSLTVDHPLIRFIIYVLVVAIQSSWKSWSCAIVALAASLADA